jgi:hypothetical protein
MFKRPRPQAKDGGHGHRPHVAPRVGEGQPDIVEGLVEPFRA